MKDIIIVGAGGFGREAMSLIKEINKEQYQYTIKGFIDDNLNALDGIQCDIPIIGKISEWNPIENEYFVMGIANPQTKETVTRLLMSKGAKFETLIGVKAYIGDHVKLGEGCVITSGSIGSCTTLGDFVNIAGSMVGQDAQIGDYSTITGFANVTNAHIGKRVFVGSHAVILNKRKIGDDAFICAGSIVFNNVKAGIKVFGNPAKKFRI